MAKSGGEVGHQIRRPSKKTRRLTFAIVRIRYNDDGTRSTETLSLPEVDAINKAHLSGQYNFEKSDELMGEVLAGLNLAVAKVSRRVVHCQDNLRLLAELIDQDFQYRDVEPESIDTFRWGCERAIEAVGHLSLYTADLQDIQRSLSVKFRSEPMKQREAVDRLNTLLRFAGRIKGKHDKLKRARKPLRSVPYLSKAELEQVLLQLPPNLRAMAKVSFGTGTRVGELFALTPDSILGNQLNIVAQLKRDLTSKPPKRNRQRMAYVTNYGLEGLSEWFATPNEERLAIRRRGHAKLLAEACRKTFPDKQEKWITWHDLRHSYAIHLITYGVSLTLVAQSLGNGIQVCQEFYAGFSLTTESVQAIGRALGESR